MQFSNVFLLLNEPGVTFALGGVLGFLVSRFTRTRAEKDQHASAQAERADRLDKARMERYVAFTDVMARLWSKRENNENFDLNDFHSVASAGDLYFNEMKRVADAILDGGVGSGSRDRTFIPALREASEKSIPMYYAALSAIAKEVGASYTQEHDRVNYQSIYDAVRKFGAS